MSAGSERGPGARAASTDAEYPYTFDDLCLALDWLAAGMCDCVAQAWVLSSPPQASGPGATRRRARQRSRKRGAAHTNPSARRAAGPRRGE